MISGVSLKKQEKKKKENINENRESEVAGMGDVNGHLVRALVFLGRAGTQCGFSRQTQLIVMFRRTFVSKYEIIE